MVSKPSLFLINQAQKCSTKGSVYVKADYHVDSIKYELVCIAIQLKENVVVVLIKIILNAK